MEVLDASQPKVNFGGGSSGGVMTPNLKVTGAVAQPRPDRRPAGPDRQRALQSGRHLQGRRGEDPRRRRPDRHPGPQHPVQRRRAERQDAEDHVRHGGLDADHAPDVDARRPGQRHHREARRLLVRARRPDHDRRSAPGELDVLGRRSPQGVRGQPDRDRRRRVHRHPGQRADVLGGQGAEVQGPRRPRRGQVRRRPRVRPEARGADGLQRRRRPEDRGAADRDQRRSVGADPRPRRRRPGADQHLAQRGVQPAVRRLAGPV